MKMILSFLLVLSLITEGAIALDVENIEENIREMGFDRYYRELKRSKNKESIKVAVFDYGFDDFDKERGFTIPGNTTLKVRLGDRSVNESPNTHGLVMGQILTQYMTNNYKRWSLAPELYFYKSDGYSNLEWAISDAVENGIDIILHSMVIEYGSNFDGRGFFNDLVNRATNAGIIWVNSAGNFGETTFNSRVSLSKSKWVELGLKQNALPVECESKKCKIRIVLSWDDFKNKPLLGSNKDLDLYITDENFERTISSKLIQVEDGDLNNGKKGYTLYPREIIETEIPKGLHYIKVKAKSDNFASTDRLRITAEGNNIVFLEKDADENLLNPADNPNVITVGEDSSQSSISKSLGKPELIAPSLVLGDDGKKYKGSSNAAAVVAAAVGLMKKMNPRLDRDAILELTANGEIPSERIINYPLNPYRMVVPVSPYIPGYELPPEVNMVTFIQSDRATADDEPEEKPIDYERVEESEPDDDYNYGRAKERRRVLPSHHQVIQNPYSIPTRMLNFTFPHGVGCYPLADIKSVEPCVIADFIIKSKSLLVATTAGLKIATSFDPIELIPGDVRLDIRDVIAIFPVEGFPFRRIPRNSPHLVGPPNMQSAIEIFKMPVDEIICKLPDWDFLMTELEVSRRRVFEASAYGTVNNYIPRNCSIDILTQTHFPNSHWGMYPILQQTPYIAPVGPSPYEVRSSYPRQDERVRDGYFRLPNPRDIDE